MCFLFPWCFWSNLLTCNYFPFKKKKNSQYSVALSSSSPSSLCFSLDPNAKQRKPSASWLQPARLCRGPPIVREGLARDLFWHSATACNPFACWKRTEYILCLPRVHNYFPSCGRASCRTIRELWCSAASWCECLPASSFYEAIMLEKRFSSPSISSLMPGSNAGLATCPHVLFE